MQMVNKNMNQKNKMNLLFFLSIFFLNFKVSFLSTQFFRFMEEKNPNGHEWL